ncbi:Glutamyl-tRNA reductase [Zhongshania aliphaticivorans]|uniref:Glutamyl-tRNA reductase n=1 Tax=Zhongshania aliphaticivorans TaxID=1470434 RepID=A0A5S9N3J6_9GAMM|nr:glutamyl-tRNA reductase [Zhongshania aliphaticivorans]CAA0083180.1 Glutamyl-tRNA reductase [Zhongshania aliphaticivorans]CAA0083603.1 Glutamyl-tRNA reductase [Zhongshania aliphaticivorans]
MNLLVIGINHNSAPVSVRERVAFVPEHMMQALNDAVGTTGVSELAILSTCNRTELYGIAEESGDAAAASMLDWLAAYHNIDRAELGACIYDHRRDAALKHMMEVAVGLDSMVLGEPQILGQMKSAYAVAVDAGTANGILHRTFAHIFSVAKRVRTETAVGENPVSVAYAAVNLTQHVFSSLSSCTALLIGAGETIELVARHLHDKGVKRIIIANRTLERAREVAQKFGAEAVMLADIPHSLVGADIVVASTASQLPILGKGAVEGALKKRKHRPMVMIDIAVPRDIEAQVAELPDVYLYTVDDLREIVEENKRARQGEARKASDIIALALDEWELQLRALDAVGTVKDYRAKAEQLRDTELDRALRNLARGDDAERVLEQLARGLTNKLIHSPTTQIKEAGAKGRTDLVHWARELFQLKDSDS